MIKKLFFTILSLLAVGALYLSLQSDRMSDHPTETTTFGTPDTRSNLVASFDQPGMVTFEKVHTVTKQSTRGAELVVPKAEAELPELVEGYFYYIEHPSRGSFLIDAGLTSDYEDHLGFLYNQMLASADVTLHTFTDEWLANGNKPTPNSVFLTHLHFDHMMGASVMPHETPIFTGPDDGSETDLGNRIFGRPTDNILEGRPPLMELDFTESPYLDLFGDGSVWAIHSPGHSPGSLAFLVNSTVGPQLITGDTTRLRDEWTDGLQAQWDLQETAPVTKASAAILKALVKANPQITVHLGHQSLDAPKLAAIQN